MTFCLINILSTKRNIFHPVTATLTSEVDLNRFKVNQEAKHLGPETQHWTNCSICTTKVLCTMMGDFLLQISVAILLHCKTTKAQ